MKTKIIIGTANFLSKYGLYKNYVNQKELISIRKYLKEKNTIFDTSFNYKNLDKILKLFKNINSNYIIKDIIFNDSSNLINITQFTQLAIFCSSSKCCTSICI